MLFVKKKKIKVNKNSEHEHLGLLKTYDIAGFLILAL